MDPEDGSSSSCERMDSEMVVSSLFPRSTQVVGDLSVIVSVDSVISSSASWCCRVYSEDLETDMMARDLVPASQGRGKRGREATGGCLVRQSLDSRQLIE